MQRLRGVVVMAVGGVAVLLAGCEGCGQPPITVGGVVDGLQGQGLVLKEGEETLAVSGDGPFAFTRELDPGSSYAVTVAAQPTSPTQTCTVEAGAGTATARVTSVRVHCTTELFTLGGTVTGLLGHGLVLRTQGGDRVTVSEDGPFSFATRVLSGRPYTVVVEAQPAEPTQVCTVAGGTGTVGGVDVTTVAVTCVVATFQVGGSVDGLRGSGLVLQDNGGDDLTLAGDGAFAFPTRLPSGQPYLVTLKTQPTGPSQTCTVADGAGTVTSADVTSVAVRCTTNRYAIRGTVSGLRGTGLVLALGNQRLPVSASGAFAFPEAVASGTPFAVAAVEQPSGPSQTCTVSRGSGVVGAGPVNDVAVSCVTNTYLLGGTVSGLAGSGLVLRSGAGEDLPVTSSGAFAFPHRLESGTAYAVTVLAQPTLPTQTCVVTGGSGAIGAADVGSVAVACTVNRYAVRGTVMGLQGTGLTLANGADTVAVSASGAFSFPTTVPSGGTFSVAVATQPASPSQTCTVSGGSGTIGSGDVTTVTVNCATNRYAVGGTVSGLVSTVVLTLNGGNEATVSSNGTFAFAATLLSGAAYAVVVKTQPTAPWQTCVVAGGTGTVTSAPITSVAVTCTTNTYAVGGTVSGLTGAGLVLQQSGADDLAIPASGAFTFATRLASGSHYAVTVKSQPRGPEQTCVVGHASGTVGGAAVTDVAVTCATNFYPVGGTVTGLRGAGLTLQDNGADDLAVGADGTFTFLTPVASGTSYAVTVARHPTNPWQTCSVAQGTGPVVDAPITSVAVSCATNSYTVGGTVSGLTGSGLVLQLNGGQDLAVTGGTGFTFPGALLSGASYAVTVKSQPQGPWQTCSVSSGAGTVGGASVTNVAVSCTTNTYAVGGTVSGLLGTGLVLQDNGGNDLAVVANGGFTFSLPVASGQAYAVTVRTQPQGPWQTCTVSNGTGTVGSGPVTSVAVSCATNSYTVGGTVSGLAGSGLALQLNGGQDLAVTGSSFTFPGSLASGASYAVTVRTQPQGPWQTCAVTGGTGTVGGANVTSVAVSCTTNTYAVGGTVSGLAGTGLELRNGGRDPLAISASGSFTFATRVASGSSYAVTVGAQPGSPSQTCTVAQGSGTVAGADVTSVVVTCVTNPYSLGGTVSGLAGNQVVLSNNGGELKVVTGNGPYTFGATYTTGTPYAVTVATQPTGPSQTCTVSNGTGTFASASVTNIDVSCVTATYPVGGTVTGLAGAGLVLQDNGADDLAVTSSGSFTFATRVASGAGYAVTVKTQPTAPWQTCSVAGGSGTVGAGAVTSVAVSCATNSYAVRATVYDLVGSGMVLQNNGGQDHTVNANGVVSFASQLSGTAYAITIKTQPTGPAQSCFVEGGTGTVAGSDVSATVHCAPRTCKERKQAGPSEPDGVYYIDPDGSGPLAPARVYCDQTTDGGGWTLLTWLGPPFAVPNGTPYPGLATCATLDCARGSTLPPTHVGAVLALSSEIAQGQSVAVALQKPTFGALHTYEFAGKYSYGSLAGVTPVYGPASCDTGTVLTGSYTGLVDGGAPATVWLDRHFAYGSTDYGVDDSTLAHQYIWSVGSADGPCGGWPDTPPSSFLGTFAGPQYGPVIKNANGSYAVFVR